jgi:hypothetical protein
MSNKSGHHSKPIYTFQYFTSISASDISCTNCHKVQINAVVNFLYISHHPNFSFRKFRRPSSFCVSYHFYEFLNSIYTNQHNLLSKNCIQWYFYLRNIYYNRTGIKTAIRPLVSIIAWLQLVRRVTLCWLSSREQHGDMGVVNTCDSSDVTGNLLI